MTKRFYRNRGTIWKNDKSLSLGDVEDRLNEQHEDLQRYKQAYINCIYDYNKLNEENEQLKQTIENICKDYEEAHGMDIRNAEWFTCW